MAESEEKKRFIRHILAGVVAIVVAVVLWLALSSPESPPIDPIQLLRPQLVTHQPAPDFELPDREGNRHRLSKLRGRPVVLNFWSIDCPPCVEEMPSLEKLAATARQRDTFAVLSISVDDDWNAVKHLFNDRTALTVLFDPQRAVVQERYGTELFPETFLIDSEGNIRARVDGQRDWAAPQVLEAIDSLQARREQR